MKAPRTPSRCCGAQRHPLRRDKRKCKHRLIHRGRHRRAESAGLRYFSLIWSTYILMQAGHRASHQRKASQYQVSSDACAFVCVSYGVVRNCVGPPRVRVALLYRVPLFRVLLFCVLRRLRAAYSSAVTPRIPLDPEFSLITLPKERTLTTVTGPGPLRPRLLLAPPVPSPSRRSSTAARAFVFSIFLPTSRSGSRHAIRRRKSRTPSL